MILTLQSKNILHLRTHEFQLYWIEFVSVLIFEHQRLTWTKNETQQGDQKAEHKILCNLSTNMPFIGFSLLSSSCGKQNTVSYISCYLHPFKKKKWPN